MSFAFNPGLKNPFLLSEPDEFWNFDTPPSVGEVPTPLVDTLSETYPWVKALSVQMSLLVVVALGGGGSVAALVYHAPETWKFAEWQRVWLGSGVLLVIGCGWLTLVSVGLARFAQAIRRLADSHSLLDLHRALQMQKSIWKLTGSAVGAVWLLVAFAAAFVVAFQWIRGA